MVAKIGISINALNFSIGDFKMINLNLEVPVGEYFVLTGPNGSGKSLLMKLIAGLLRPASGRILIGEKDVTALPPWERGIGYLSQDSLLFPNRTVAGNIAFALEVRGVPKQERLRATKEVAERTGVGHLLGRTTAGLSGGEQQKVNIARVLIAKPAILLLDEPVSAIEEKVRDEMCIEFKRLQMESGVTAIHISHNRHEAMLVADHIGTMLDGCITDVKVP